MKQRSPSPRFKQIGLIMCLWTCLLLVACGGGGDAKLLFQESFVTGQTGPWLVESDAGGSSAILDEQLQIELAAASTVQYAALQEPSFSDLILEVDATLLAGSPAGSYGLLFRVQDDGGFYRFNITGDGLYILERYDADGRWTRLTDGWQETAAIRQGINVSNHLKIVAGGPNILLFVNDEPLGAFMDAGGYARGRIALNAGTFGNPDLRVAFDDVVVRKP